MTHLSLFSGYGGSGHYEKLKELNRLGVISEEELRSMSNRNSGQLNPDWVDWLMGLPSGWTDIDRDMPLPEHDPHFFDAEPSVPHVATDIKNRVARLTMDGNGVVPQQVYPIFAAIAEIERTKNNGNGTKTMPILWCTGKNRPPQRKRRLCARMHSIVLYRKLHDWNQFSYRRRSSRSVEYKTYLKRSIKTMYKVTTCEHCVSEAVCKYKEKYADGTKAILDVTIPSDGKGVEALKDCPHLKVVIECPYKNSSNYRQK